ncbi:large ribosomal subunit protein eL37-like [Mustela lutreola]|uniref:large ribosomal subunit protein eL37-like n=1 Tax=Mustela lutreola TaxID=9666 RepID=UPI0027971FA0|nr:large ribosomal subunit protein eL37-like [Mustela lutreola]
MTLTPSKLFCGYQQTDAKNLYGLSGLVIGNKIMKGSSSYGQCRSKIHRCCCRGSMVYHLWKSACGKCGYPAKCKRKYNWSAKAKNRNSTGTCQMRHLRIVLCRFRHGVRERTPPQPKRAINAAGSSF